MQVPAQNDLGRGFAVGGGNLFQHFFTEDSAPAERTPGLSDDLVIMVEFEQRLLSQQRVQFNLIDHWHFVRLSGQVLQVDYLVIADPDGLGKPGLLQVLKCPPGFKEGALDRPVDKQEVNVVRLEFLQ